MVRTFDKRPLYIPNSVFTTLTVENPSRMSNRRIKETIGIRYQDASKMGDIVAEVKSMLEKHEEIDSSQTLIVNFNAYSASSLDFFIYTFTKTTNWIRYHEIKQDVMLGLFRLSTLIKLILRFQRQRLMVSEVCLVDLVSRLLVTKIALVEPSRLHC